MQQQLAINPCVCGISNAICPVHPPLGIAPSNLIVPRVPGLGKDLVLYVAADFDSPMKLMDDVAARVPESEGSK